MLFVVLCPGTPEGSIGSGFGFKASQKTGQRLKVSSERLGEAGNRTCDPWFTRHRFIPYTTAAYEVLLVLINYNGIIRNYIEENIQFYRVVRVIPQKYYVQVYKKINKNSFIYKWQ